MRKNTGSKKCSGRDKRVFQAEGPSGNKITVSGFSKLESSVDFELGGEYNKRGGVGWWQGHN